MADLIGERVVKITANAKPYRAAVTRLKNEGKKELSQTIRVDLDDASAKTSLDELNKRVVKLKPTVKVKVDTKQAEAGLKRLDSQSGSFIDKYAKGMLSARLATVALGTAALPAAAAIGSIAGAAAALPGLLAGAASAAGALKIGMSGVSDAFANSDDPEKFAEAMAKLSPAARDFVSDTVSLKGAWDGVKNTIQDSLFDGLGETIKDMAEVGLPTLEDGLSGIAGAFNGMAKELAATVTTGQNLGFLSTIFDNTAAGVDNASLGVSAFATGFLNLGAATSTYFAQAGGGFTTLGGRFQEWAARVSSDGTLDRWIENGVSQIQLLFSTITDLGAAFGNIFAAISGDGQTLLESFAGVAERFRAWTEEVAAQQGIRDFFAGIRDTIGAVWEVLVNLGPAFAAAFGAAKAVVEPLVPILIDVSEWIGENTTLVGALVAAFVGFQIASSIVGGVSAAVGLFNSVMAANPIALVVLALGGLVAGFAYLWTSVEGFRNFWIEVWTAIQTAFSEAITWIVDLWNTTLLPFFQQLGMVAVQLWEAYIRPVWEGIKTGFSAVVEVLSTLWNNVLWPVFTLIGTVVSGLWTIFFNPVFTAIQLGWSVLLYGMQILWKTVLEPVFTGIGTAVSFMWNNIVSPIWSTMQSVWSGLGSSISGVWTGVLKPLFDAFGATINWLKGVFQGGVDGIVGIWNTLKELVAAPIKWIVDVVWNNGIRKAWNWISDWWGGDPIAPFKLDFASGGVFDPGATNSRATGGVLPGHTPGRDIHKFYSATGGVLNLSGGEAIMRPEFTQLLGGREGINALNRAAMQGDLEEIWKRIGKGDPPNPRTARGSIKQGNYTGSFAKGGVLPGGKAPVNAPVQSFDKGGVWEIPSWASWLVPDWIEEMIEGIINSPFFEIIGGLAGEIWEGIWTGLENAWDAFWGDDVDKASLGEALAGAGQIGGAGYKNALTFAQKQKGKPYVWAAVGPGGYDCLRWDTPIMGPDGAKAIRDVRPGDRVWSIDESTGDLVPAKVAAQWRAADQMTYQVRTRNRSLFATEKHPFARLTFTPDAFTSGSKGNDGTWAIEWVKVRDLNPGDYVVTFQGTPGTVAEHSVADDSMTADFAWFLGLYVADGCLNDDSIRLAVYDEIRDRATQVAYEVWNRKASHGDSYGMIINKAAGVRWMREHGFDGAAHEKKVPACVWTWPAEAQRAFLEGYADGDGWRPGSARKDISAPKRAGDPDVVYKTVSRQLLTDIRALHMHLGDGVSNIRIEERKKPIYIKGRLVKNARPLHTFQVSYDKRAAAALSGGSGKMARAARAFVQSWNPAFGVQRILDIAEAGVEETYDIEVEGTHNFVADGMAVHNCSGFMSAITNVIRGRNPHSRIGATASFPWPGFVTGKAGPFTIGSSKNTGSGIGHMAGTLMGIPVESTGGAGVLVGSGGGHKQGIFNTFAGLFDNGGYINPGFSLVQNRTGRPEAVLTPTQTDNLKTIADQTTNNSYGTINVTLSVDDVRRIRDLDQFLEVVKSARNTGRQTARSGYVAN